MLATDSIKKKYGSNETWVTGLQPLGKVKSLFHLRGSPVCQELGGRWGKREDSRQTLWEQCPFSDQCPVHSVTPSPWTNSTVYLLPSRVLGAEDRVLDRGTLILVEKTV